jgi:competence protein ComGC
MLELIIVLAIYSILVLLFVPLKKIGEWQSKVRGWEKKVKDKLDE